MSNPFAGTWTYRSFLNNPALTGGDPNKLVALLFAEATWTVQDTAPDVFQGQLSFGSDAVMDLLGVVTATETGAHAHIVGKGRPGTSTAQLFYDYDGALTEKWPQGVNQVPAITGSVIRMKPHDGQPAGLVASFIAVKSG